MFLQKYTKNAFFVGNHLDNWHFFIPSKFLLWKRFLFVRKLLFMKLFIYFLLFVILFFLLKFLFKKVFVIRQCEEVVDPSSGDPEPSQLFSQFFTTFVTIFNSIFCCHNWNNFHNFSSLLSHFNLTSFLTILIISTIIVTICLWHCFSFNF